MVYGFSLWSFVLNGLGVVVDWVVREVVLR